LNVSLQTYIDPLYIAIVCSSITFVTGLLGTIELYLQLQKRMETCLNLSKDLFMNSMDIYKILSLDEKRRKGDAIDFLQEKYDSFRQIIEQSELTPDENILPPVEEINRKYHKYEIIHRLNIEKENSRYLSMIELL
jgi:hypothetical protein